MAGGGARSGAASPTSAACQRLGFRRKLVRQPVIILPGMSGSAQSDQSHGQNTPAGPQGGKAGKLDAQTINFWNYHRIHSHNLE
jgi:hypothetical protein